jgi:hypothetical protein
MTLTMIIIYLASAIVNLGASYWVLKREPETTDVLTYLLLCIVIFVPIVNAMITVIAIIAFIVYACSLLENIKVKNITKKN